MDDHWVVQMVDWKVAPTAGWMDSPSAGLMVCQKADAMGD